MASISTKSITSYAKVNLLLNILNKDESNYHNLITYFQLLDFGDDISLVVVTPDAQELNKEYQSFKAWCAQVLPKDRLHLVEDLGQSINVAYDAPPTPYETLKYGVKYFLHNLELRGFPEDLPKEKNLIYKAIEAVLLDVFVNQFSEDDILLESFVDSPDSISKLLRKVTILVDKVIPMEAGLAGGSSNASYVVMALDEMLELHLSKRELISIMKNIGADCSIFIADKSQFAVHYGARFLTKQEKSLIFKELAKNLIQDLSLKHRTKVLEYLQRKLLEFPNITKADVGRIYVEFRKPYNHDRQRLSFDLQNVPGRDHYNLELDYEIFYHSEGNEFSSMEEVVAFRQECKADLQKEIDKYLVQLAKRKADYLRAYKKNFTNLSSATQERLAKPLKRPYAHGLRIWLQTEEVNLYLLSLFALLKNQELLSFKTRILFRDIDLSEAKFLLIIPKDIKMNTKEAFSKLSALPKVNSRTYHAEPITACSAEFTKAVNPVWVNDFQPGFYAQCPVTSRRILDIVDNVKLTGTGSTLFFLARNEAEAKEFRVHLKKLGIFKQFKALIVSPRD